jgi:hypothetical protein
MGHLAQLTLGPLGCLAGLALCMAIIRRARPSRTWLAPASGYDASFSKVSGSRREDHHD